MYIYKDIHTYNRYMIYTIFIYVYMSGKPNLDGIFHINQLISQGHRSQNIVVAPSVWFHTLSFLVFFNNDDKDMTTYERDLAK